MLRFVTPDFDSMKIFKETTTLRTCGEGKLEIRLQFVFYFDLKKTEEISELRVILTYRHFSQMIFVLVNVSILFDCILGPYL